MIRRSVSRNPYALWWASALICVFAPGMDASTFTVAVPNSAVFGSPVPVGVVSSNNVQDSGARASTGSVGARTLASSAAPNALVGGGIPSFATAAESIDDLILNGPAPFVTFPGLTIGYGGIFGYAVDALGDVAGDVFAGASNMTLDMNVALTCLNCGVGYTGFLEVTLQSPDEPQVTRATGTAPNITVSGVFVLPITSFFIGQAFAGVNKTVIYGIRGSFDSGPLTLPTGVPITISMGIQGSVLASSLGIAGGSSFFDLSHTLGLPQGVPVFDLPPGFSADAPSIGLVNNIIGDPASAAAPEPGALGLAVGGFLTMGVWLRRRQRRVRG